MSRSDAESAVTVSADRKGVQHESSDPVTTDALKRLRNIEGQVRGLQRMIEEDQYCIDILTQISAVLSALNRVGMKVLRRHIDTCVAESIRNGGDGKDEMTDELMTILERQQI